MLKFIDPPRFQYLFTWCNFTVSEWQWTRDTKISVTLLNVTAHSVKHPKDESLLPALPNVGRNDYNENGKGCQFKTESLKTIVRCPYSFLLFILAIERKTPAHCFTYNWDIHQFMIFRSVWPSSDISISIFVVWNSLSVLLSLLCSWTNKHKEATVLIGFVGLPDSCFQIIPLYLHGAFCQMCCSLLGSW